ncbi:MAG: hypothetical protein ACP5I1_20860, partial [Candidatus Hinthialibacter sp.]
MVVGNSIKTFALFFLTVFFFPAEWFLFVDLWTSKELFEIGDSVFFDLDLLDLVFGEFFIWAAFFLDADFFTPLFDLAAFGEDFLMPALFLGASVTAFGSVFLAAVSFTEDVWTDLLDFFLFFSGILKKVIIPGTPGPKGCFLRRKQHNRDRHHEQRNRTSFTPSATGTGHLRCPVPVLS